MSPALRQILLSAPFTPARLFRAGEQGAYFDPSDWSTLFQDSAGTTPVTAVEQPVGKSLDKSGRGNHATQATAASRPVEGARVNLLLGSDRIGGTNWTLNLSTATLAAAAAPDGTTTASKLIPNNGQSTTGNDGGGGVAQTGVAVAANAGWRFRVCAKAGEASFLRLRESAATGAIAKINLTTGAVTYEVGNSSGMNVTTQAMSNGWWEILGTRTTGAAETTALVHLKAGIDTGDGVSGCYVWGADLRTAGDAAISLPAYQRVNTSTDYDTAGFPQREKFDGVDDFHTAAAGGGSTTGFFFCAAIRVAGSAGAARTLWSDAGANTGYRVRINASNQLELAAGNGSAFTTVNTTDTLSVGSSYIVTVAHDGVNLSAQVNQGAIAQAAFGAVTAGTAGFTRGRDNGASSSYFNGSYCSSVYRAGPPPDAATIAKLQRNLANAARISL